MKPVKNCLSRLSCDGLIVFIWIDSVYSDGRSCPGNDIIWRAKLALKRNLTQREYASVDDLLTPFMH